jgi:hypothetical protein
LFVTAGVRRCRSLRHGGIPLGGKEPTPMFLFCSVGVKTYRACPANAATDFPGRRLKTMTGASAVRSLEAERKQYPALNAYSQGVQHGSCRVKKTCGPYRRG